MIFNSVCIYVTVDMFVQFVEDAIHAMDTGRHRDRARSKGYSLRCNDHIKKDGCPTKAVPQHVDPVSDVSSTFSGLSGRDSGL